MLYRIEFTLEGKRRSIAVEDGSHIVRPPPVPNMELPAAQATWDWLSQQSNVHLLTQRPE